MSKSRLEAIPGEIEMREAAIALHEAEIKLLKMRIRALINERDDLFNDEEYRQSDECRAGISFNEWNRRQLMGGR